ncbi:MAG: right-handed parallel beta-helix repeat-containing protein, partial [Verrucomicrobiae bacterium]|nr:right-handed parallel beta-helix repeat-containing protein [Verrucomicrobiae bacterium]
SETGVIDNITLRDLLVENFAGDCVAVGRGCRNITIRDISVRNFIRQGIQLAGDENARDYLVTGCQDLEPDIEPGGSTIHVEHARGLKGVIIQGNRCRKSILAGGVDGLIIRDNVVHGRIEGNSDRNALVQGNTVFAAAGDTRSVLQFGYAEGLAIKDNIVVSENPEQLGIYVWGASKYNPEPSRLVCVTGNLLRVKGRPIALNGVTGGIVADNLCEGVIEPVEAKRTEKVEIRRNANQEPTKPG